MNNNDKNYLFHKTGDTIDIYLDLNSKKEKTVTFKPNNHLNGLSFKLDITDFDPKDESREFWEPIVMEQVYKLRLELLYNDIKVQLISFRQYQ